jgi:hypothetical protein
MITNQCLGGLLGCESSSKPLNACNRFQLLNHLMGRACPEINPCIELYPVIMATTELSVYSFLREKGTGSELADQRWLILKQQYGCMQLLNDGHIQQAKDLHHMLASPLMRPHVKLISQMPQRPGKLSLIDMLSCSKFHIAEDVFNRFPTPD